MTSFRDAEIRLANPPGYEGVPDEAPCDRCQVNDLTEPAYRVKDPRYPGYTSYWCGECVEQVERCSDCGLVRCACA